jgi:hypothetical protein
MAVLRWLSKRGMDRGLKGSRAWLAVGLSAGALRVLGVLLREHDTPFRGRIRPGDAFEVRMIPRTRRDVRQAERARRRRFGG